MQIGLAPKYHWHFSLSNQTAQGFQQYNSTYLFKTEVQHDFQDPISRCEPFSASLRLDSFSRTVKRYIEGIQQHVMMNRGRDPNDRYPASVLN